MKKIKESIFPESFPLNPDEIQFKTLSLLPTKKAKLTKSIENNPAQ